VLSDDTVPHGEVGGFEDSADAVQGHVEVPETADDLRHRDLIHHVLPVARAWIDRSRLQESDPMVVAQHLDAHAGGTGEITDREHR